MSGGAGWLEISTAGFASFNSSRQAGHLVKELVQNSFDAIGDQQGEVALDYRIENGNLTVECRDNGEGMTDLSAIRVVYLTFKKDSHLKRGRFGRGFKEVLSVAKWATVSSGVNEMRFLTEEGKQVARAVTLSERVAGTTVRMALPYGPEAIEEFDTYFGEFIVPANIRLLLNGGAIGSRTPKHIVEANLTTEVYHGESHSWRKPKRRARIELVPTRASEDPKIFEMGIPVASAEWTVPFHVNVLQRVPMNPNRDALASGYARSIHGVALPVLLPDLDSTAVTADWVGAAGTSCDEEVQKQIVVKAFGENAVRAVPVMGKRDFNDDAERVGAAVVQTAQMSAGFREMAKSHLPTAKQRVDEAQRQMLETVSKTSVTLDLVGTLVDERAEWIKKRGGVAHVERCLSFGVWFCQKLVDHCDGHQPVVTGAVAIGRQAIFTGTGFSQFLAHWDSNNKLTLALDCECFWTAPLGSEALAIFIHEAAHAQNQHHGKGFHAEVERLGGVGASVMFNHASDIRARWPDLVMASTAAGSKPLTLQAITAVADAPILQAAAQQPATSAESKTQRGWSLFGRKT